jgi:hypothetical protein
MRLSTYRIRVEREVSYLFRDEYLLTVPHVKQRRYFIMRTARSTYDTTAVSRVPGDFAHHLYCSKQSRSKDWVRYYATETTDPRLKRFGIFRACSLVFGV